MTVGAADEAPAAPAALAADPVTRPRARKSVAHPSRPPADLVDSLRHVTNPMGSHGWQDVLAGVLKDASDERIPVLERTRLLSVFSLHLDAFFMIHVPGPRRTTTALPHPGLPAEVLHELSDEHDRLRREIVRPALAADGMDFPGWGNLNGPEQEQCRRLFRDVVHPLLTPLVVDATHPFPQVSALSLNLAVLLRDRRSGVERFACVQVPTGLPGFLRLDARRLVCIDAIVGASLGELFQGMQLLELSSFRVTRTERFGMGQWGAGAGGMLVRGRRLGLPVRLEVEHTTSPRMLDFLARNLDVAHADVYRVRAPLGMAATMLVATGDRRSALSPPPEPFTAGSPLAALSPSLATSGRVFLQAATSDPTATMIAQTLSQCGAGSGEIGALVDAASAGKQVLVILESRRRDSEWWASAAGRRLTGAGCQVVYGPARIQRACALGLALCDGGGSGVRWYSHMCAPGHYRWTDSDPSPLGLISADQEVCSDVAQRLLRLAGSSPYEYPARMPGLLPDEGAAVHLLRSSRIAGR